MDEGFRRGLRRPRRRSYGIAGSGGAQRCDLLPLEVENAATTTPKQPGAGIGDAGDGLVEAVEIERSAARNRSR
jgi:hypothetical protein